MNIADIVRGLAARGFRLDDAFYHPCEKCEARAVGHYVAKGNKLAGRQIALCNACGAARSWRRTADSEDRVEDTTFDIARFLE